MSHFLRPLLARHRVAQLLVNERTGAVVADIVQQIPLQVPVYGAWNEISE